MYLYMCTFTNISEGQATLDENQDYRRQCAEIQPAMSRDHSQQCAEIILRLASIAWQEAA